MRNSVNSFFNTLFARAPEGFKVLMVEKDSSEDRLSDGQRVDPKCNGSIWAKINRAEGKCLYFHCGVDQKMYRKKRLRKQDVDLVCFLWVDIDNVGEAKLNDLISMDNPPTFIVKTGNGYHAYWLLDQPVPADEGVENRNRWLASQLGGDSVCDVSRLLRVPGSKNTKREPHCTVEVVWEDKSCVYVLDDFPELEGANTVVDTSGISEIDLDSDFVDSLPGFLKSLVLDPIAPGEDRSARGWKLANKLAEMGKTEDLIFSVLTHPKWPIGEKGRDNKKYAKLIAAQAVEKNSGMAAIMSFIKEEVKGSKKKLSPINEIRSNILKAHEEVLQEGGPYRPTRHSPKQGGVFGYKVAEIIEEAGYRFVFDPEYGQLFIADRQGGVWEVTNGGKSLSQFITYVSGFASSQQEFGFISLGLQDYIECFGEQIEVGKWVHYDAAKEQYYILADDRAGLIYCVDKNASVSEERNGENDVFLRPRTQSFLPLKIEMDYLGKAGMEEIERRFVQYIAGGDKAKQFLQCFMIALTLCYGADIRTLPILHLTGPSGGGKSSTLGCMTSFLFGFFQVLIYTTAGAFRVVPSETFMAHDDKESVENMEEFLLLCATSATRTMADNKSTDSVVIQKAHVVNAITSIGQLDTTALRRRALVLEIDADKFPSKQTLTEDTVDAIIANRGKMWAGVVPIMGAMIRHFSDGTFRTLSKKVYNRIEISTFRGLADFLALMVLVQKEISQMMRRPFDEDVIIRDFIEVADLNDAGEILGRDPLVLCLESFFEQVFTPNGQEIYYMDDISDNELRSIAVNRGIRNFQWELTSEEENKEAEKKLGCKVRGIKASATGWVSIFSTDTREFAKTLKSPPSLGKQFSRVEEKTDFPFYITKGRDRKLGRIWNAFQKIE